LQPSILFPTRTLSCLIFGIVILFVIILLDVEDLV
jgi:hypothetical protein